MKRRTAHPKYGAFRKMAAPPRFVVEPGPPSKGHFWVCATYSETMFFFGADLGQTGKQSSSTHPGHGARDGGATGLQLHAGLACYGFGMNTNIYF